MASCSFCNAQSGEKLKSCVCGKVSYCNKECQAKDWKNHRPSCPPFTIREVPGKGRGMVATRRIQAGQVIVEEMSWINLELPSEAVIYKGGVAHGLPVEKLKYQIDKLDDETRDKILGLHDPAENIQTLRSQNINVEKLCAKNPNFYHWKVNAGDYGSKLLRIFTDCNIKICPDPALYNSAESGLFQYISFINHSCNPNVFWTWVMGDFQRKQVRALKMIEKNEEISANYWECDDVNLGSREYRQQFMLENHGFLCKCSECSLEGKALEENDRLRKEARTRIEKIVNLLQEKSSQNANTVKKALKLSQEMMERIEKLDVQIEILDKLLQFSLPLAYLAKMRGIRAEDPQIIKLEAMRYCKLFGDAKLNDYKKITKGFT